MDATTVSTAFGGITAFFANLTLAAILPCIVILVAGLFAVKFLAKLFEKGLGKSKLDKGIHKFLATIFRILLTVLVLLIAASALGIDVTSLIAVLSVASLAISLAVQDSLANVAGGIMILTSHPFTVGDFVEVGGSSGTAMQVGLAYTTLKTADNKIINIPNKDIAASRIVNYSREEKRRVDLTFTASYDSPVETVIAALTEAADVPQRLPEEAVFVKTSAYQDSAIEYVVRIWVKTADYWTAYYQVIENVKKVFDEKGVIMTYPHTIVHLEK